MFSEAILGDIELETAKQFCEIQSQDLLEYLNVTKMARDIERAAIEDSRKIMKILLSKSVNAVKEAVWVVVDWEKIKKISSGNATFKETIGYTESLMTVLFVVDGVAGSIDRGVKVMSKDIGIPTGISVGDTIASSYKTVSIPVVSVGVGTEVVYGVSIPVVGVLGVKYMGGEDGRKRNVDELGDGSFKIKNWDGYPDGPKPDGPFKILEGEEYNSARKAANNANAKIHRGNPSLKGKQIHEVQPVKFGGSPTDTSNKIPLSTRDHAKYTTWWNRLLKEIKNK